MDYSHCEGCPLNGLTEPIDIERDAHSQYLIVTDTPSFKAQVKRAISPQARELIADSLKKERFDRGEFAVVPQVRCAHDPDTFTAKEKREIQSHCRQHLLADMAEMRPDVVIPFGAEASKQVLGIAVKISKVRGVAAISNSGLLVMPMLNPNQVLVYPQYRTSFDSDFATFGRLVDSGFDISVAGQSQTTGYEYVDDLQFLVDAKADLIAFDTETSGLRWYDPANKILTMQFSIAEGQAYMLSWDHPDHPQSQRSKSRLKKQIIQLLCREEVTVVGQNTKFDNVMLWMHTGIRFKIKADTLMLAVLLDENKFSHSQDDLVREYVPAMGGYADRFNATVDKSKMEEHSLDQEFLDYGCGDADSVLRLYHVLYPLVAADKQLLAHYNRVSLPTLNAFAAVETRGMLVDEDEIGEFEVFMTNKVEQSYRSLLAQVPRDIRRLHIDKGLKFSRSTFVIDILFRHPSGFRLRPRTFTKTTAKLADVTMRVPSTSSKDHLPYFFDECPFTFELAQYIKDERMLNTSIIGFKKKYVRDGIVRPNYSLHKAVTGRSSCVKGDTPIVTMRGKVRADRVMVGDMVWTHKGRWRKVMELYRKPVTQMYSIVISNGEVLTVTGLHKLLLINGEWATVDSLILVENTHVVDKQISHARPCVNCQRSGDVSYAVGDIGGSGDQSRSEYGDSTGNDPGAYVGRTIQHAESYKISEEQISRKEPSIWEQMGIGLRGWQWVSDEIAGRQEVFCASNSNGRVSGDASFSVPGIVSDSSHRREPEKQRDRQSGTDNEDRAYDNTSKISASFGRFTIKEINSAGVHRVYDFQVEEDHSYLACGVFSHNSDDPNGQNVPKRGAAAKAYRKIFFSPEGCYILEADESQAELRIAADMANDPVMLQVYRDGGDIHTETALIVKSMTQAVFDSLSKDERDLARFRSKAVNFGFLFGMWWKKFLVYAKTQYGVTFTDREAKQIREGFFSKYFKLVELHEKLKAFARENKYVRSYSGRIRHLPMIDSPEEWIRQEAERQAINSSIQEFASSLGLMSMARVEEEIDDIYLQLVSFVHDAIYAYTPQQYVEWGAKILKRYMQTNPIAEWFGIKLKVPIEADVSFGINLGDMKELKELRLDPPTLRGRAGSVYDFGKFWDAESETGILVPPQEIPPNDGRRIISPYTECA